jgi:dephospho-CoA kinase
MLRVGLIPGGATTTVRDRLLELGAVRADAAGLWTLDDAGVALVPLVDVPHLAVGAMPAAAVADVRADVTIVGWAGDQELVALVDGVWRERLVPFEENLRLRRRAPRRRTPLLVGPDAGWASDAARLVARLHAAVGPLALRIDHIGSTSVPGMRAKDLIDIQVTVRSLDDARAAADAARSAGVVHVAGDWSGEDRSGVSHPEAVAVDADPGRPTNVNFRPVTAPVWRDALLFRDWLRSEADERASYEAMKCGLATADDVDVDRYGRDKMPWIRTGLARAELWAAATGWAP